MPAKPGLMLRLMTITVCALSTSRINENWFSRALLVPTIPIYGVSEQLRKLPGLDAAR
jgi:hypothetical protein